jgi:hypothetical protein
MCTLNHVQEMNVSEGENVFMLIFWFQNYLSFSEMYV